MLRRTANSFAKIPAVLQTSRPVYELLNAARGTSAFDTSKTPASVVAALHKRHIHLVGDYFHSSQATKDALRADPEVAGAIKVLDAALDPEADAGALATNRILILFGSQTGTAEHMARMTGLMAAAHGMTPTVCSMNDALGPDLLGTAAGAKRFKAVLFITSTYGTGEFPTNAQRFVDHLPAAALKDKPVAVMGLGNSSNTHNFNGAAKALVAKLKEAGAVTLQRPVYSCELQGHDATFRAFKADAWASLAARGIGGAETAADGTVKIPDAYQVSVLVGATPQTHWRRTGFIEAKVTYNERVTASDYHAIVEFPLEKQVNLIGRRITATDQLVVAPSNAPATVDAALKHFGLTGNEVVECAPLPGAAASFFDGQKITTRTLFSDVIDFSGVPARSALSLLSCAATDPKERAQLEELANDLTSSSVYTQLTTKGAVLTVLDVLKRFPSVKLTLSQAVTRLPHIQLRYYSNAHDPATTPEKFHVVYHVPRKLGGADGKTVVHEGLATAHMKSIVPASLTQRLWCTIEAGKTTLPAVDKPALLIGLGSGMGLVKACLDERAAARKAGKPVGPTTLIYGFRDSANQLFKPELAQFKADGVDVRLVESHDASGRFVKSPFSAIDPLVAKWLKEAPGAEVLYVGLGGSIPGMLSKQLTRHGVDVQALRKSGRYHEEYFAADLDQENMLKRDGAADGATLAERFGDCEMLCMQCEQTQHGTGCTRVGVCGKTPAVAALQDLLVHQAKILGFWLNAARAAGADVPAALNRFTLFSLFTTLTNVNFDASRFVAQLGQMHQNITAAKALYVAAAKKKGVSAPELATLPADCVDIPATFVANEADLVAAGRAVGVLSRFTEAGQQNTASLCEVLTYGLKGLAAYADHALVGGFEDPTVYAFLHRALAFLLSRDRHDLGQALAMCLECGKVNAAVMTLLQKCHNENLGVQAVKQVPVRPRPGKCILVSGHDMIVTQALLKRCEKEGVDVYTHGELLPAFARPALASSPALAGHYGTAWMRQSLEFPHFPGPVLMTTNCLTEPQDSYAAHLFTAGAVGWKGTKHLGDDLASIEKNFDQLIAAAKAAPGFTAAQKEFGYPVPVGQTRPQSLTVGFGTEVVVGAAPTILDAVQKGLITRFHVIGGCDGFEGTRGYFESLTKEVGKTGTGVVLTVGCGKYRFNHMDIGTIGQSGVPRLLDLGQCNDAISAVQIALALSEATKTPVADLPISITLSWFEQKAVAVLLSLLHLGLKPIRLGPTLPAFVTKDVLQVLVDKFGVMPCGDAAEDLKAMNKKSGMS
jgi:hydroxylamine reductase